jgi:hypothetical protein
MSVFVLDCQHRPLDPCSEKRARLLRERGRAVVHRRQPYTIRLKDRRVQESMVHPYVLKFDPGSQVRPLSMNGTKNNAKEFALLLGSLETIPGAARRSRAPLRNEKGGRTRIYEKSSSGKKENDMVE